MYVDAQFRKTIPISEITRNILAAGFHGDSRIEAGNQRERRYLRKSGVGALLAVCVRVLARHRLHAGVVADVDRSRPDGRVSLRVRALREIG